MKVYSVYFSATGTTKKVVSRMGNRISEGLGKDIVYKEIDITNPGSRKNKLIFGSEDIVVFGVPTYAGRVPNLLLPFLKTIKGNGALCIPVVLFGNRNYDDSLIELSEIMRTNFFRITAAGAFVGEHSFSIELGKGRPDNEDFKSIDKFAMMVCQKILSGSVLLNGAIMGAIPYRDYFSPRDRFGNKINFIKIKPKTTLELCDDCKICYEICPLGSIEYDDVSVVSGKCMKCCACVKKCPKGSKFFDDEGYLFHKDELEYMYHERKEIEVFL